SNRAVDSGGETADLKLHVVGFAAGSVQAALPERRVAIRVRAARARAATRETQRAALASSAVCADAPEIRIAAIGGGRPPAQTIESTQDRYETRSNDVGGRRYGRRVGARRRARRSIDDQAIASATQIAIERPRIEIRAALEHGLARIGIARAQAGMRTRP